MTPRITAAILAVVALVGCTDDGDESAATAVATPERTDDTAPPTPSTSAPEPDVDDFGSIPDDAAGEATGPLGSTEIRVDTGAGTVQIGSGSVPAGLDPTFPLPSDFLVELASETDTDLGFSGTSEWSFGELVDLYETGLPLAGYRIESIERRGSEFAVLEFTNDFGLGQVAISASSSGAGYTVIVAFGGGGDEAQREN